MTISKIIGVTDPALNVGVHTYFSSSVPGDVEIWSAVNNIEEIPEAAIFCRVNPDWPILVLKIVGIPAMMRLLHAESYSEDQPVYEKLDEYQSIECLNMSGNFYVTINTLVPVDRTLSDSESQFNGNYQRVCCSMVLTKEQRRQVFTTIGERVAKITDKYKVKSRIPTKITSIQ
jgi:hypothetical protein